MYGLNEKLLADLQGEIRRHKKLTPKLQEDLHSRFGEKFDRAFALLQDRRIKKYTFMPSRREVWIVVGRARDYQILPRLFCMCDDFYLNVIIRRTVPACYHLLAQLLAETTNQYDDIKEDDAKYDLFMQEWSNPSEEPSPAEP